MESINGSIFKNSINDKKEKQLFDHHVIHKVPSGDGPYVRAKHAQLVHKDPETSIVWFWKAINAGDRVDSALKDMAVVMKQLDRTEEAIEAIKYFRGLCPKNAQGSLDNVLIDLYKKCGKVDEQIVLLKHKLKKIYLGEAFHGKHTKTARSHGKKCQVSVRQETSRVLGNLGWAYMQKSNYMAAEVVYRKAQMIDPDANKALNLCHCLIIQTRFVEADLVLRDVLQYKLSGSDDFKSRSRAQELLFELYAKQPINLDLNLSDLNFEDDFVEVLEHVMHELDFFLSINSISSKYISRRFRILTIQAVGNNSSSLSSTIFLGEILLNSLKKCRRNLPSNRFNSHNTICW